MDAGARLRRELRATWPLAVGLTLWFALVPLAIFWLRDQGWLAEPDATSLATLLLLALNPVVVAVLAVVVGYRRGLAWPFAVAAAVAWLPALAVYGTSALAYAPLYGLFALLGLTVGWGVRTLVERLRDRG